MMAVRLPEWVNEIIKQTPAIILGVLIALWVDQWKSAREDKELAVTSLQTFLSEIQRNAARLDDALPYHKGIRTMLARADSARITRTPPEFQTAVGLEPLRAPTLLETAWITSVSTNALTKLDYETVAALSLTYTLQSRVREESRSGIERLIAVHNGPGGEAGPQLTNYTRELVNTETELRATYAEAERVIKKTLESMGAPAKN